MGRNNNIALETEGSYIYEYGQESDNDSITEESIQHNMRDIPEFLENIE
jgi:hypothetical protein